MKIVAEIGQFWGSTLVINWIKGIKYWATVIKSVIYKYPILDLGVLVLYMYIQS